MAEDISIEKPSGADTPLRHFKGTLSPDEKLLEKRTTKDGSRSYEILNFKFSDLEVIESVEIYPFPIATITMGYAPPASSRGGTKFEALASSLRKLMPDNPDINLLKGKSQEWQMVSRSMRSPLVDDEGNPLMDGNNKQLWGEVPTLCWTVVAIEGLGSAAEKDEDFNVFLVALADGKTEPAFYEAAFTHEEVTSKAHIVKAITDRKLISTLTEMNLLTRDAEGILHKGSA